jgi:hypothetical protein
MAKYSKEKRPSPTPKARKPWVVTAFTPNGDKDEHSIHYAVGRALNIWNNIEIVFGALFSDLNEIPLGNEALHRAYGSVITFRAKADMLAAAGEVYFHKHPHSGHEKRFSWVLERGFGFSARRNEIAHGIVNRYRWFMPTRATGIGLGFVLGPSMFTTGKRILLRADGTAKSPILRPKYVYSSANIHEIAKGFEALYDDLVKLHDVLWSENWDRHPASLRKPVERRARLAKGADHKDRSK